MKSESFIGRWNRWRQHRTTRKYRQHLKDQAQKPRQAMPPIRRTLTIPLQPSANADRGIGNVNNQSRSLLWSRLTFDTRQAIYREVLGDRCFHIIRKYDRLGFLFYHVTNPTSHTRDGCWGCENMDGTFDVRYSHSRTADNEPWYDGDWRTLYTTDGGLLPLLLTCRAM